MTPQEAYAYARDAIKGPTPQNEHIIIQDPYYSYKYAFNILRTRFHKGEHIIATDRYWAYCYAQNVLKGRFPIAEPKIKNIYNYTNLIISHTHANYHLRCK